MIRPVRSYNWSDGKSLTIGKETLIMGIVNITPDSFSDGGKWNDLDSALRHAEALVEDGAHIIDIGAESSRPGCTPISEKEEIERLLPILERIVKEIPIPISVDTFKAATAEMAIKAGVHIINDIWGLQYVTEPGQMAAVAANYNIPIVAMHNQKGSAYNTDLIWAVEQFFAETIKIAATAGINPNNIILDPGIGFGKTAEQNRVIIRRLEELTRLPYPMLIGTSRKGFIGSALNLPITERMEGTAATCLISQLKGCDIMRVHDVKPIARMCRMTDYIVREYHG